MKRFIAAVALAACSLAAQADGITQLKRFVTDTRALKADFTQTVSGKQVQTASGTLELSRPGKFRWTYVKPYDQLIVGDGVRLWVYDKELEQVTTKKLDEAIGSSPAALLAGSNNLDRDYHLKNIGQQDGLDWLEALPKHEGTFKSVRMGFKNGNLFKMTLADNFGQTTALAFTNQQKNPKLAAERFRFVPPKGVDVVGD